MRWDGVDKRSIGEHDVETQLIKSLASPCEYLVTCKRVDPLPATQGATMGSRRNRETQLVIGPRVSPNYLDIHVEKSKNNEE